MAKNSEKTPPNKAEELLKQLRDAILAERNARDDEQTFHDEHDLEIGVDDEIANQYDSLVEATCTKCEAVDFVIADIDEYFKHSA